MVSPAFPPSLVSGEVHLWRLEPAVTLHPGWHALLDAAGPARAARFRCPHLTHSFIADHARLRILLAGYLNRTPQSLRFTHNRYGKPVLTDAAGLFFNLSHTARLALVAV